MDPPVSVPRAATARSPATAAAEPPDDPPGTRPRSHGLRVSLNAECSVTEPIANSSMFVLPRITAPAALSWATGVASYGGTKCSRMRDPHVVVTPSVQNTSLIAMGTPSSGPSGFLARYRASAARAAASAASRVTVRYAPRSSSCRSMRARYASATLVGVASPRRKTSVSSWEVRWVRSPVTPQSSMMRGTRKNSPARSGALLIMASRSRLGSTSSSRITLTRGTAWDVGSTPATSTALSFSMYWRMAASSTRMRSSSASVRASRPSRATCSTSLRSITSQLLEVCVLERQPLATDAGEAHRHDDVGPLPLHPHHQPFAPARVAHASADLDREIGLGRRGRRLMGDLVAQHVRRRLRPRVQGLELPFRHLAEEPRRLPHAIAVNPPVERPGEEKPLLGPGHADVAEPPLLLDLLGVVHRAGVRKHALFQPRHEHRGEFEALGRVERHQGDAPRAVPPFVHVAEQRDAIQEAGDGGLGVGVRELFGRRDQLLQVLQASLGFR